MQPVKQGMFRNYAEDMSRCWLTCMDDVTANDRMVADTTDSASCAQKLIQPVRLQHVPCVSWNITGLGMHCHSEGFRQQKVP